MSETPEPSSFEEHLRQMRPTAPELNVQQIAFEAGRRSMQRHLRLWAFRMGGIGLLMGLLIGYPIWQKIGPVRTRYVYVSTKDTRTVENAQPPSQPVVLPEESEVKPKGKTKSPPNRSQPSHSQPSRSQPISGRAESPPLFSLMSLPTWKPGRRSYLELRDQALRYGIDVLTVPVATSGSISSPRTVRTMQEDWQLIPMPD